MEITLLAPTSLRLKGRQATLVINPQEKASSYQAALVFNTERSKLKIVPDVVCVEGAGDYEVGGIKFSGTRYETSISYEMIIDEVSILVISGSALAKFHQKLHDYDIVCVEVSPDSDPSLSTNVANAAVLYFGPNAESLVTKTIKDGLSKANKFNSSKDKLPTEIQQILLV